MFTIQLTNVGKKYNREWIFRQINTQFSSGTSYAVLGPNGSGKSTLLQVLAGVIVPSEGSICFKQNDTVIAPESIFEQVAIAAPYLELIEEYTFPELIDFQQQFKPFQTELPHDKIVSISGLEQAKNKQIRYFSSGMKQRARLTLAILSAAPILLLDEPTSNLDTTAISWYQQLIKTYTKDKLVVVCSNHIQAEMDFCEDAIDVLQYK